MKFGLKPGRSQIQDTDLISDLDALVEKPIAFRLFGKNHVIKPITTEDFFKVTNALNSLDEMKRTGTYTEGDLIDSYAELFCSVCDTITKEDIRTKMAQPQIVALLALIIDAITGKAHQDIEKKKRLLTPPIIKDNDTEPSH